VDRPLQRAAPEDLKPPGTFNNAGLRRHQTMGIVTSISTAFDKGGWGMWPILITLMITVGIIVERSVYLFKASVDKDKLLALLKSQVMSGNVQGAIKVCSGNPTPMTRIVQAGLMKFNKSDDEVQAAMDEAALRELPKINARTPYLAMLANFAVMAGLIGTITGMIKSFGSVGADEGGNKATELANGISEALNCTAFGIGTSLVGLLGYSLLQGKTTKIVDDINEVTVQVVNLVTSHRAQMQPGG
jgi:biopolymer transport protein ExbB/TolQ